MRYRKAHIVIVISILLGTGFLNPDIPAIQGVYVSKPARFERSEANRVVCPEPVEIHGNEGEKKAVILAGSMSKPGEGTSRIRCIRAAFRALSYLGYSKDRIYCMAPHRNIDLDGNGEYDDIDAPSTYRHVENAFRTWPMQGGKPLSELLVFINGHGDENRFLIDKNVFLAAEDLDDWLDVLQIETGARVIVIYDACLSGAFLSALIPSRGLERIVITGSSRRELSYFDNGGIRSFSYQFWVAVSNGESLLSAFQLSVGIIRDRQRAMLDADGNGKGNERSDFIAASKFSLNGRNTS